LDACFVVRDHSGQQLAYVYFENEPGRRRPRLSHYKLAAFRRPGPSITRLAAVACGSLMAEPSNDALWWRWVIALATMWAMFVIAVAHVTGWL
jgi:hypothetical protein